jgi:glutamate synthase domain-containing protein 1
MHDFRAGYSSTVNKFNKGRFNMASITTEAMLQHHVQALTSGNMEEFLKDYTEDSVLFTPAETYKGLEGIKAGLANIWKMAGPEAVANIKATKQEIQGEYVYVLWTMPPAIPFGGDMFHIRNGKIVMQSVFFSAGK